MRSKKRSAASYSSKQPNPPVFFIDRSLGKNVIARALRGAGIEVRVHDDMFAPDTPDRIWLREVGLRGWIVLTKDAKIRYRRAEIQALRESGVGAFVLTAGDMQAIDMAQVFISATPSMLRFVARTSRPFLAAVTRRGSISRVL